MKEARYFYVPDALLQNELPQEEAMHASKVLRLQQGDEVFLMDGAGYFHRAELTLVSNKHCLYNIVETTPQSKAWKANIHLAIAPTKNIDRIEWMAEKCTEIGWDRLTFLNCKFSERKQIRIDRIEKIVTSAVKQSRKPFMPVIDDITNFREFVTSRREGKKYICHCYEEIEKKDFFNTIRSEDNYSSDTTILVGPEGDFSIDEVRLAIENGYESITLGSFRLRTETAGLMSVTMCHIALRV